MVSMNRPVPPPGGTVIACQRCNEQKSKGAISVESLMGMKHKHGDAIFCYKCGNSTLYVGPPRVSQCETCLLSFTNKKGERACRDDMNHNGLTWVQWRWEYDHKTRKKVVRESSTPHSQGPIVMFPQYDCRYYKKEPTFEELRDPIQYYRK